MLEVAIDCMTTRVVDIIWLTAVTSIWKNENDVCHLLGFNRDYMKRRVVHIIRWTVIRMSRKDSNYEHYLLRFNHGYMARRLVDINLWAFIMLFQNEAYDDCQLWNYISEWIFATFNYFKLIQNANLMRLELF